ncbi:MAG: ATP-binding protein [Nanoarchaeota archaeon]|nr:ATP-binding protein [Nanoarchaeota archaeon]
MAYNIIIGRGEDDKKKLGDKGLIYLGKGFVKMGQYTSLSNKLFMDVVRSHVVLVAGKRGSGKSYTLGVIAEELSNLPKEISQNIASLIFDTMGIYWTMKYSNEKDKKLLEDWDLKSKKLPTKIFVPFGYYDYFIEKGVPVDEKFALDVTEMNSEDWILTFGLNMIHPVSVLIERTLSRLKDKNKKFTINDIIESLEKDSKSNKETINATVGLFEAADTWGIFSRKDEKPTSIRNLINAGKTSVLDLSVYNSVGAFNVRALVISLLSRKIFNERMAARKLEEVKAVSKGLDFSFSEEKKENPLVWMFIDEAHEFLPKEGKTIATDALVQILREGRQPGLSLVLATQQPGQIHRDVMTQSDIVLAHRVTSKPDIDALNHIMQTYLTNTIQKYMNDLPSLKGSAIILDDNSERIYPMRMRPRFTWHGGQAPSAISEKKEL